MPLMAPLLLLLLIILATNNAVGALNQDGLHLLDAKRALTVSSPAALADWNPRDATPCKWTGVTCDHDAAVTAISLPDANLSGSFPPALCRLPRLRSINLFMNYIGPDLPSQALAAGCKALQHLDLSMNALVGPLPDAYMPNGSLGDVLHGNGKLLDWPTRYKIALDAAEGLSYLHHDCVPPIVHRDVKSNNILLDAEFGARVADFGLAKEVLVERKSMSVIAGSCGYIAPEYAYTLRVNEKSDTYSFGVVLLELVTGKPPVGHPEFGETKDLVKWVCSTMDMDEKGVERVVDSRLDMVAFGEEITRVLHIGLLCASSLPINRPAMRKVVKMLQEAPPRIHGKLSSPHYYYYCYDDQRSTSV